MSVDMLELQKRLETLRDYVPLFAKMTGTLSLNAEETQVLISLIVESRAWSEERTKLQKRLDGVLHTSTCTRCGYTGVPEPVMTGGGDSQPIRILWMCGNPAGCAYQVPDPKSAVIVKLTARNAELERSLSAINDRFEEALSILETGGQSVHLVLFATNVRLREKLAEPIPLILRCPSCHLQHIDVDDESGEGATTRHHRKHLCKPEDGGCGLVWAPTDRFTVGVRELTEVS